MIKLAEPSLGEAELAAVKDVFQSGWLCQGDKVEEFENQIADYVEIDHAVAVSSGTAALHLALKALGLGRGDRVIVPAATFPATVNVVEHTGATPILVDIDLDTFNLDPKGLELVLEEASSYDQRHIKAIIPVHLCGKPAAMAEITGIAKVHDLAIVEDAACALGAKYMGQNCGVFGNIGCFSFHPRKNITTGEGGVAVTNNLEVASNLRIWRDQGQIRKHGRSDFVLPGYNYRMTDFQGAIGCVQMQRLEDIIIKKSKLAALYDSFFQDIGLIKTASVTQEERASHQSYVAVLDESIDRDRLIMDLREVGIETTLGTYAIHMLDYYREKYGYQAQDFPEARILFEQGLSLPLHGSMNENEVTYVAESILTLVNERR